MIKIKDIIVTEIDFSRKPQLPTQINMTQNLKVDVTFDDKTKTANLVLSLIIEDKPETNIHFSCTFVGIFDYSNFSEYEENPNMTLEKFMQINAAAMVFPYIRELVSNIFQKSGLPAFYLNTVNFAAEYKKRVAQKNN